MTASEYKTHIIPLYGAMRAIAIRYLGEEDGFDAVQDVLKRLWENRSDIDIRTNFKIYVLRATKNRCLDRLRSPVRLVSLSEADSKSQDDEMVELERLEKLEKAMNVLDPRKRKIIDLSLAGMKGDEIAEHFNMSPTNVRQMLSRARQELKRIMINQN